MYGGLLYWDQYCSEFESDVRGAARVEAQKFGGGEAESGSSRPQGGV
jgi:hypothetical protein